MSWQHLCDFLAFAHPCRCDKPNDAASHSREACLFHRRLMGRGGLNSPAQSAAFELMHGARPSPAAAVTVATAASDYRSCRESSWVAPGCGRTHAKLALPLLPRPLGCACSALQGSRDSFPWTSLPSASRPVPRLSLRFFTLFYAGQCERMREKEREKENRFPFPVQSPSPSHPPFGDVDWV